MEVVLERRSGDKKPRARVKDANDLTEHRVDVLDAVRFVDDDVLPGELLESALLAEAELVRGDEDVEGLRQDLALHDFGLRESGSASVSIKQRTKPREKTYALLLATAKHDYVESRNPAFKLASPVVESTLRDDDEMRAMNATVELEVAEEGDRLECLAESLQRAVR